MTHPCLPLWIDDYDAATSHLTAAEDGVYGRLLRLAWRTLAVLCPMTRRGSRARSGCRQRTSTPSPSRCWRSSLRSSAGVSSRSVSRPNTRTSRVRNR
uniref:DUF1376 domain-containing protein n=1 Tax=Phenylobacterium glaciei TaxID=2803784 RepID=A0A974P0X8_9CAUL|nr:DUF1376 domain-containing protein [Phenylobacterium glaciei]